MRTRPTSTTPRPAHIPHTTLVYDFDRPGPWKLAKHAYTPPQHSACTTRLAAESASAARARATPTPRQRRPACMHACPHATPRSTHDPPLQEYLTPPPPPTSTRPREPPSRS